MGHPLYGGTYPNPLEQRPYNGPPSIIASLPLPPNHTQYQFRSNPQYRNEVIIMNEQPPPPPPQTTCVQAGQAGHAPAGSLGWPCSQCNNTTRIFFEMRNRPGILPAHHHHHMMATHPMTPCVSSNVPLYHQRLWYNQHRVQEMQRRRMDMMNG